MSLVISIWVELDGEPNKPIKVISKEDIADVEDYILIHPRFKDRFTSFNLVQVERTVEGVETEGIALSTWRKLNTLDENYHIDGVVQTRLRIKLVQPPQTSSSHKRKGMDDETLSEKYESLKKYTRLLEMDNEAKDNGRESDQSSFHRQASAPFPTLSIGFVMEVVTLDLEYSKERFEHIWFNNGTKCGWILDVSKRMIYQRQHQNSDWDIGYQWNSEYASNIQIPICKDFSFNFNQLNQTLNEQ
ncbi:hypothetical protein DLAC_02708 [Tieghemostelium lacteum]|uniref:Uncharacterized protein n=1 Tax=Tieghemostelium lacteum TaxID=361077 RepID=A0A152A338_TIELA|nr:hypothetical protein DLAC_02708 [Tieghemostelium lacteum]|eukprot:KYR00673.1 hypothetical protein DLAC_02708 [Tieghemostelium lacteum]